MSSILTSNVPDRYNQARHVTKKEVHPVCARHRFVLELHLAGVKVRDRIRPDGTIIPGIVTLTGYKEPTIYKILSDEDVIQLKQQIMCHYDKEFEAQYQKVVDAVGDCLDQTKSDETRLKAAKLWGEFHKKFQKADGSTNINITAEDIVLQIMNGDYNAGGE